MKTNRTQAIKNIKVDKLKITEPPIKRLQWITNISRYFFGQPVDISVVVVEWWKTLPPAPIDGSKP